MTTDYTNEQASGITPDDPGWSLVCQVWDAIEALFAASLNPELTRQGLHEFVDVTAAAFPVGGAR